MDDEAHLSEPQRTDRFLTAAEIGKVLGVPKSWVYEKARYGALPHFKFGRYIRFSHTDVLAWTREQKVN